LNPTLCKWLVWPVNIHVLNLVLECSFRFPSNKCTW